MVNENLKPIINQQKLVEEVRELEETSWWKEYQNSTNKSNLSSSARNKVISKSGSDFVSERGKEGYGPMPFGSDSSIVASSHSIMSRIERDFPNVAKLLKWNRELTLAFLKDESAFSAYRGQNAFRVPCSHTDDYSKTGPAAWTEYHKKIREYVSEICQNSEAVRRHYEELREAREDLAKYIWDEYYNLLPYWPSVGGVNERSFEANKRNSYEYGSRYVVWNCLGWIYVKDERPARETFKASFRGSPEIKLLILDLYELRRLEEKCERVGIEEAKSYIRGNETSYRRIGWADF